MLHTLKNQTLGLFCLTYNSFLLESRGRVFLYTDSMHAVSRSELRTWQVMPYFRVAYIASTSLPCFSVRCSHVIFAWVYIIIIISITSPISIAPLHTWHLGCDLLRSVMFSFLAKQSICVYDILMQSRASAEMIRRCRHALTVHVCLLAAWGLLDNVSFINTPSFKNAVVAVPAWPTSMTPRDRPPRVLG